MKNTTNNGKFIRFAKNVIIEERAYYLNEGPDETN